MDSISWNDSFYYFTLFRALNGPDAIPGKESENIVDIETGIYYTEADLSAWIREQNQSRKKFLDGKLSTITANQIKTLDSVSFPWILDSSERWDNHFQELFAFKEEHGNCDVPTKGGKLGTWVKNQRAAYRKLHDSDQGCTLYNLDKEGGDDPKKTTAVITYDQVKLLSDLGFQWVVRKRCYNFEQLLKFVKENGHCRVNRKEHTQLAQWISDQRTQYKRKLKGEKSTITDGRIEMLESVDGFDWKVRVKKTEEEKARIKEEKKKREKEEKKKENEAKKEEKARKKLEESEEKRREREETKRKRTEEAEEKRREREETKRKRKEEAEEEKREAQKMKAEKREVKLKEEEEKEKRKEARKRKQVEAEEEQKKAAKKKEQNKRKKPKEDQQQAQSKKPRVNQQPQTSPDVVLGSVDQVVAQISKHIFPVSDKVKLAAASVVRPIPTGTIAYSILTGPTANVEAIARARAAGDGSNKVNSEAATMNVPPMPTGPTGNMEAIAIARATAGYTQHQAKLVAAPANAPQRPLWLVWPNTVLPTGPTNTVLPTGQTANSGAVARARAKAGYTPPAELTEKPCAKDDMYI